MSPVVIVKYRTCNDPEVEPFLELDEIAHSEIFTEFSINRLFEKKSGKDQSWKTVNYIQACVKDSIGVGKPISVHFFAPLTN